MSEQKSQPPVDKKYFSNVEAAIWKNVAENGNVSFSSKVKPRYQDDQGNWHSKDSFSGAESLFAEKAHSWVYTREQELRYEHYRSLEQNDRQQSRPAESFSRQNNRSQRRQP